MSSHESVAALELRPRPSRALARWVLFVHGVAMLVAIAMMLLNPWWWPLLAVVAVSLWWTWRDYLRGPCPGQIQRLVWQADNTWIATDRHDNAWQAQLLPSSYIHPRLLVLRFSTPGRWRNFVIVLCRDSERAATLRALRRRLTVERRQPPSPQYTSNALAAKL